MVQDRTTFKGNPATSALRCRCNDDCKLVATRLGDHGVMTATPTITRSSVFEPVQRLLDAIASGAGLPDGLFTADAVLDATVPMWRYEATGGEAVRNELAKWYALPACIDRMQRRPFPGGEAIEIDISWVENGVPHAGHQLHVLGLSGDRIASDTVFCGGRWPAELLADMEAARAH